MSEVTVKWEELVKKFSQSVGRKKSEELVEKAVKETGAGKKNIYSKEEVLEIAEAIKDLEDSTIYVDIAANTLKTNVRTSGTAD